MFFDVSNKSALILLGLALPSVVSTTTVTMTMTYIPVQTSNNNNNKLLYVPVNSIQASTPTNQQHQTFLNSNNQQPIIDRNDALKSVLLSHQQTMQPSNNVVVMAANSKIDGAFTTVRIQGAQNTIQPLRASASQSQSPYLNVALKQEEGVDHHHEAFREGDTRQVVNSAIPREVYNNTNRVGKKDKSKRKQLTLGRVETSTPFAEEMSSPVHKKRRGRPPLCEKFNCLYFAFKFPD